MQPVIDDIDRQPLHAWFTHHGRRYPWRETKDPYLVLVSAFMLQRTGVSQVMNVYPRFVARYPNLSELAQADLLELAEHLRPLGRLNRLGQLLALIGVLRDEHGGTVPEDLPMLDALPGLGQYSARSVMCMAFGHPYIMLDPNSYRVVARAWGFLSTKARPHTDRGLIERLDAQVPADDPRSFNLALLDLGSQICRGRKPRHDECPLAERCLYLKESSHDRALRE